MTKELKIYLSDGSEKVERKAVEKGCRGDVLVEADGVYYAPDVMTSERVKLEFDIAKSVGAPCVLNNTLVVDDIKTATVIKAIKKLAESGFSLTPVDLAKEYKDTFPELTDIKNWKRVY